MSANYMTARLISRAWGLRRLVTPPANGLRILMYHAIGSRITDDPRGLYTLTKKMFECHVQAMTCEPGLRFAQLDGDPKPEDFAGRVAVTFDDGYRDNLHAAAPILNANGIPFSVFVITRAVHDADPQFLSPVDVRRLADEYGAVIGSHGATHTRLAECDDRRLREELVSSKRYLEDLLGREVATLSYPHGSVDRRVRDAAAEAGYRLGMTSFFGTNNLQSDRILLARLPVMSLDGVEDLRAKLCGDWDWYRWRQSAAIREAVRVR